MNTLRLFNHHVHVRVFLLGLLESIWLVASVYGAVGLRYGWQAAGLHEGSGLVLLQALLFALAVLMSLVAMGVYQPHRSDGHLHIILRVSASFALAWLGLFVVFYVLPSLHLARGVTVLATAIGWLGIVSAQLWDYRSSERHAAQWKILFYGAGKQAETIFSQLRRRSDHRFFKLVGCVPAPGEVVRVDAGMVCEVDGPLADFVMARGIDEVVVCMDDRRGTLPSSDLVTCRLAGINIIDELTFYERQTGKIKTELLSPGWLIFSSGFRQSHFQNAIKRGMDIVCASVLLIVSSPIMLLTAAGIKIEDGWRAPVLFIQQRIGLNGRTFRILKFRSMRTDSEQNGAAWAQENDTRITLAGTFIRKHRFDELPQLWNVIRGDMSLVGPRPEQPEFVQKLAKKFTYYPVRHQVRPGITGWAQLGYPYGASDEDANAKLQLDLYYVKNRSLFLDWLILLGTIEAVLFQKGAR